MNYFILLNAKVDTKNCLYKFVQNSHYFKVSASVYCALLISADILCLKMMSFFSSTTTPLIRRIFREKSSLYWLITCLNWIVACCQLSLQCLIGFFSFPLWKLKQNLFKMRLHIYCGCNWFWIFEPFFKYLER